MMIERRLLYVDRKRDTRTPHADSGGNEEEQRTPDGNPRFAESNRSAGESDQVIEKRQRKSPAAFLFPKISFVLLCENA